MEEQRTRRARANALLAGLPDILFPPIGKDMLVLLCLLILKACAVANCLIKNYSTKDAPYEIASQIKNDDVPLQFCNRYPRAKLKVILIHTFWTKSKMTCRRLGVSVFLFWCCFGPGKKERRKAQTTEKRR